MSFWKRNKSTMKRIMIVILMLVITIGHIVRSRNACTVYRCNNEKVTYYYCEEHKCQIFTCSSRKKESSNYCHLHACPVAGCSSSTNCYIHSTKKCRFHNCDRDASSSWECGYCHAPNCSKSVKWSRSYCYDHICVVNDCDKMKIQGTYFCKRHQYYIYNIEDEK